MNSLILAIRTDGSEVWSRFNASKQDKLDYFRAVLDLSEEILPRKHLEEMVSALKDLEYSEYWGAWEGPERPTKMGYGLE
jgi:hypothetical protein